MNDLKEHFNTIWRGYSGNSIQKYIDRINTTVLGYDFSDAGSNARYAIHLNLHFNKYLWYSSPRKSPRKVLSRQSTVSPRKISRQVKADSFAKEASFLKSSDQSMYAVSPRRTSKRQHFLKESVEEVRKWMKVLQHILYFYEYIEYFWSDHIFIPTNYPNRQYKQPCKRRNR